MRKIDALSITDFGGQATTRVCCCWSELVLVRCVMEAKSRGFDNALVLDMLGNVAEAGTSNLFMVKDGVVKTPASNGTFLAAVTRSRTIELLRGVGRPPTTDKSPG